MTSPTTDRPSPDLDTSGMATVGASLSRLVRLSEEHYYNPYEEFVWPVELPLDQYWMSPELLSIAGTELGDQLDEVTRVRLSHAESINFYTLNVHGIRQLMIDVLERIHTPRYRPVSEFLHHFVKEENEHMWFFAEFAERYGPTGLNPDRQLRFDGFEGTEVQDFLAFARIMMFEEIGHRFNLRMANDERLPPIVRQINRQHHQDESRHIAFGRRLVGHLFTEVKRVSDDETIARLGTYCHRFLVAMLQSLYNPAMYRDAGIADAFEVRRTLLADPGREPYHDHLTSATVGHLHRIGVLESPTFLMA